MLLKKSEEYKIKYINKKTFTCVYITHNEIH